MADNQVNERNGGAELFQNPTCISKKINSNKNKGLYRFSKFVQVYRIAIKGVLGKHLRQSYENAGKLNSKEGCFSSCHERGTKKKILSPREESNLRPSYSALRCFTTEP